MRHKDWVENLIGPDSMRTAAAKLGLFPGAVSQQISRGSLKPDMVIALCRAYGRSPLDGLERFEAGGASPASALREATNQQILGEIMRRSDADAVRLFRAEDEDVAVSSQVRADTPYSD
jgi:hypothetical protein